MTVGRDLVSVVIPAYNAARFIADAIDSVLAQTYRRVECVVVDDGSTDATADVVRRFGDAVRLVSTPNRGVSSARNTGAEAATGRYLAFLDADDLWLPRKVELQVEAIERDPEVGMVYTGLHLADVDLNYVGRVRPPDPNAALRNTLLLERPVMSMTYLLRAEVFEKIGGFDDRLSTSADCDFSCRAACFFRVAAVYEPLLVYRYHHEAMHANLKTTEHDMLIIFNKFFSSDWLPADLRRKRNRALANLHVSLAGAYMIRHAWGSFLSHAGRALVRRPDRVLDALRRLATAEGGITRAQ